MAKDVRFGCKLKLTIHQRQETLARKQAGEALTRIAKRNDVSRMAISRL
jgi:hypothetical protein